MFVKKIALVGALSLISCYPFKVCKKGIDAYECKLVSSFSDEWSGRYARFTRSGNSCAIDILREENYEVLIDTGCDSSVDAHMIGDTTEFRDSFADKYDSLYTKVKDSIGDYDPLHEHWEPKIGKNWSKGKACKGIDCFR